MKGRCHKFKLLFNYLECGHEHQLPSSLGNQRVLPLRSSFINGIPSGTTHGCQMAAIHTYSPTCTHPLYAIIGRQGHHAIFSYTLPLPCFQQHTSSLFTACRSGIPVFRCASPSTWDRIAGNKHRYPA